jgi:hypothetical protein
VIRHAGQCEDVSSYKFHPRRNPYVKHVCEEPRRDARDTRVGVSLWMSLRNTAETLVSRPKFSGDEGNSPSIGFRHASGLALDLSELFSF